MTDDKRAEALAFLRHHTAGVLSTSGSDGQPHASAIFYSADEHFNVYFLTLLASRKYKAMKENPKVAFAVGTEDVPLTIQVEGVAEEIQDDAEKQKQSAGVIDVLMQHSTRYYAPLTKLDRSEMILMWIQPKWIRWADYSGEATGSEHVWTEVAA
jgi:nitroimidazol reductase NimA-like FMN-containing flavoprotein (pyridoxamine 5'-phosphate oxidase superfamily)